MNISNLVGLDLKIDQNFIAAAVKQTVMMGISEALTNKKDIASHIVHEVLTTKVDPSDGRLVYDSDYPHCTMLEYYVSKLLKEIAIEEIASVVSGRRSEIRQMIRKELSKEESINSFADTFIKNTTTALQKTWQTKIDISFTPSARQ